MQCTRSFNAAPPGWLLILAGLLLVLLLPACSLESGSVQGPIARPVLPSGVEYPPEPQDTVLVEEDETFLSFPDPVCTGPRVEQLATLGKGFALAVAWSPDDTTLAVSSTSGLYLFDFKRGIPLGRVDGVPGSVNVLEFSPDGVYLAAADSGGLVYLVDVRSLQVTTSMEAARRASMPTQFLSLKALVFSPDSSMLATLGSYGNVLVWDLPDGSPIILDMTRYPNRDFEAVLFLPDNLSIQLVGAGVRQYRLLDGKMILEIELNPALTNQFVSQDGQYMVSWNQSRITGWQIDLHRTLITEADGGVFDGAFLSDPNVFLLQTGSGLQAWSFRTGGRINIYSLNQMQVAEYEYSRSYPNSDSNGEQVAYIREDGTVHVIEVQTGRQVDTPALDEFYSTTRYYYNRYYEMSMPLLVTGDLVQVEDGSGFYHVWNMNYQSVRAVVGNPFEGPPAPPALLSAEGVGNQVFIRDQNGEVIKVLEVYKPRQLVFSPDYSLLGITHGLDNNQWSVWNTQTEDYEVLGRPEANRSLAFSFDGRYLLVWQETLDVFDVTDWNIELAQLPIEAYGAPLGFWPDNQTLVMSGGNTAQGYFGPSLVDLDSNRLLELPEGEKAFAYDPPLLVVTTNWDGLAQIFGCR